MAESEAVKPNCFHSSQIAEQVSGKPLGWRARVFAWNQTLNAHLLSFYRLFEQAEPTTALEKAALFLRRDEVLRLEKRMGVEKIKIRSGTVWVTGSPANGDILLGAGDELELSGEWPFVLQALRPSEAWLLGRIDGGQKTFRPMN